MHKVMLHSKLRWHWTQYVKPAAVAFGDVHTTATRQRICSKSVAKVCCWIRSQRLWHLAAAVPNSVTQLSSAAASQTRTHDQNISKLSSHEKHLLSVGSGCSTISRKVSRKYLVSSMMLYDACSIPQKYSLKIFDNLKSKARLWP